MGSRRKGAGVESGDTGHTRSTEGGRASTAGWRSLGTGSHPLEMTVARLESTMNDIVKAAAEVVVDATAKDLSRRLAELLAAKLNRGAGLRGGPAAKGAAPRRRGELTRWVADRRARRVPTFVIEATGLKTKRAIVAKYGDGAAFQKGRPPPKAR